MYISNSMCAHLSSVCVHTLNCLPVVAQLLFVLKASEDVCNTKTTTVLHILSRHKYFHATNLPQSSKVKQKHLFKAIVITLEHFMI